MTTVQERSVSRAVVVCNV